MLKSTKLLPNFWVTPTYPRQYSHLLDFCFIHTFAEAFGMAPRIHAYVHYPLPVQAGCLNLYLLFTMAKMTSANGKASGRVGGEVYAINSGVQIKRAYNATVANPNTEAQQNTRSKFKLMSQLGAVMAPVIAIKKEGIVSARNIFSKINFPACTYQAGVANINLNKVQLTKSNRSLGGFTADRTGGTAINVALKNDMGAALDKVVYCLFEKQVTGELLLKGSAVVETAGAGGTFAGSLPASTGAVVVYAYGIKISDAGASAKFGNLIAPTAEDVAKLLVTSSEVAAGTSVTATAGLTMLEGEDTGDSDDVENILVSCTVSGNGSATGAGRYVVGQTVTMRATPDAEASFVAWKAGTASGQVLSTNAVYTFEATENIAIVAVFQGGPVPHYTISATVDPSGDGSVTGTGSYEEGATVNLVATPAEGKRFLGWYQGETLVSSSSTLTFTAQTNRSLIAKFGDAPASGFSNVKFNGNDWNSNTQGNNMFFEYSGDFNGDATKVVVTMKNKQAGEVINTSGDTLHDITNGHFATSQGETLDTGINYLYAVKQESGQTGTNYTVVEKYQYTYNAIEE